MKAKPILIQVVEDDEWYNKLLVHTVSLNPDFEVKSFFNAKDFLRQLDSLPHIVTLDHRLPDMQGTEVLSEIRKKSPDTEVIIISEQQEIAAAVELFHLGVYDYLIKEKNIREKLLNTLNNILKTIHLKERVSTLEKEVGKKYDFSQLLIGESEQLKKVEEMIGKAIGSTINVIITGETGTGKEVVAKSIHFNSVRHKKPFVAVNVAAIPSELIESELFGHEKGAFTGASARRIGKFEEANGGTLFLDEIGEMDISIQAKLLRALQEKEITRVGDNAHVKVDCRIIVATHRNLKEEVSQGRFREDLYYRLFGLPIELPPLRERGRDVLLLANEFISSFCEENAIPLKALSPETEKKLMSYTFPGNIRELKSVVELAVVLSDSEKIYSDDIKLSSPDAVAEVISEEASLREYNIRIVKTYLRKYNNDVKLVAQKLGIGSATIYRMQKEDSSIISK
ncbi:MAG: sigma-54-dependent Fis family transcriptional regulator [Bacteroidetes bacterium]|nr:sigma-54-dependent Fis family transcriptional regulator [Bacteroidota bacterium]